MQWSDCCQILFFFNTYGTWYSGVELSDSDSTVGLRGGINNPSEKLCL